MNMCITYTTNIYSLLSVLGIFLLDVLVVFFFFFYSVGFILGQVTPKVEMEN